MLNEPISDDVAYDPVDGYTVYLTGVLGQTFAYAHGIWRNLGVSPYDPTFNELYQKYQHYLDSTGVPISEQMAACGFDMVWDAQAGYIVLTGGYVICNCRAPYLGIVVSWGIGNQTWAFVHGEWEEINTTTSGKGIFNIGINIGTMQMVYDAEAGYVVLNIDEVSTWIYSDGNWINITQTSGGPLSEQYWRLGFSMAYDPADGSVILVGGSQLNPWPGAPEQFAWSFSQGVWSRISLPPSNLFGSTMAYDPAIGCLVSYGGYALTEAVNAGKGAAGAYLVNVTWLYCGGQWVNITRSMPGSPPPLLEGSLLYDYADGYLLLFGGYHYGVLGGSDFNYPAQTNISWKLTTPALSLAMGVEVTPAAVCSVSAPGCIAGTTQAQVTLQAAVVEAGNNETVTPGIPWPVLGDPTLTYVPAGDVSVVNGSGAAWQESCENGTGATISCTDGASEFSSPGCGGFGLSGTLTVAEGRVDSLCAGADGPAEIRSPSGAVGYEWAWDAPSFGSSTLSLGDTWAVSFEVQSGPPAPGVYPVDVCAAPGYGFGGSPADAGWFSEVGYHPYGNGTRVNVSFPLGVLLVLGGGGATNSVGNTPPPPPPPVSSPVAAPAPLPTPGSVTPVPIGTVGVGTVGPNLGLSALGAGAMAAGLLRALMVWKQRMKMPVATKVGGAPARSPEGGGRR